MSTVIEAALNRSWMIFFHRPKCYPVLDRTMLPSTVLVF